MISPMEPILDVAPTALVLFQGESDLLHWL